MRVFEYITGLLHFIVDSMDSVLTLMCNPVSTANGDGLDSGMVTEASGALRNQGADTDEFVWLSTDNACDIPFQGLSATQAEEIARLCLQGFPVDIVAQPESGRRKKLLIADMDSTIVTSETLDELAEFAGCKEQVAAITARAMNGQLGFADAFRERVRLLTGLQVESLEKAMADIELTPGAMELVKTMRANGARTMLASGGLTYFTERIADKVGFHEHKGNVLEIRDERFTGEVTGPIVNKDAKLEALQNLANENAIDMPDTMAVGDGANDLPMLLAAGLGVAFYAKPVLAGRTRARIQHADLTALLYMQGYSDDEIVR